MSWVLKLIFGVKSTALNDDDLILVLQVYTLSYCVNDGAQKQQNKASRNGHDCY